MKNRGLVFLASFIFFSQVAFSQTKTTTLTICDYSGDCGTYSGPVVNGKANGIGTLKYAKGDVFVGKFKDNFKNGQGTYTWANGGIYKGNYKNDKMSGSGTWTGANGDIYEGNWVDDKQSGPGTYTWADGVKYVGNWVGGQMMGQGIKYFPNGNKYVGSYGFLAYKPNIAGGLGILYFANGAVKGGFWISDKLDQGYIYPSRERYSPECYIYVGTAKVFAGGKNFTGYKIKCGSDGVEKTIYFNDGWREDGWFSSSILTAKDSDTWEIAAKKACLCK